MNARSRARAGAGRHSGGADRSRRSGDLSRSRPARGLSAHRRAARRASACASWSRRWSAPSSTTRRSPASRRVRARDAPGVYVDEREARERRSAHPPRRRATTAWRSTWRWTSSRSRASIRAATRDSRSSTSRTSASCATCSGGAAAGAAAVRRRLAARCMGRGRQPRRRRRRVSRAPLTARSARARSRAAGGTGRRVARGSRPDGAGQRHETAVAAGALVDLEPGIGGARRGTARTRARKSGVAAHHLDGVVTRELEGESTTGAWAPLSRQHRRPGELFAVSRKERLQAREDRTGPAAGRPARRRGE